MTASLQLPTLSLLALSALLLACSPEPPAYSSIPPGARVLAFGDSVTFGTGAGPGEDYPSRLAQATGWQVVNAGIPGDLARDAVSRLGDTLAEHEPALVMLWLGGNDFLRKRPERLVKRDLRSMIREIRAAGAEVVLVAVPRLSLLRASVGALEDAELYGELAQEESVFLVRDTFSAVLSDEQLLADKVHPNAEGYRVLTAGFIEQLRAAGYLR